MSVQSKITGNSNVAIFTRNHEDQLEEATARGSEELTTFRAGKRWVSAEKAVNEHGNLRVYFSPINNDEEDRRITHSAAIQDIELDPERRNERTEELLDYQLDSHAERGEGLKVVHGDVGTLYAFSYMKKLNEPFPFTELVKLRNDEPLDENYSRQPAYCYKYDADR